jgi:hypothetical protein
MDEPITLIFTVIIVGLLIALLILYFVGLGFITKTIFNLKDCGCTTTTIIDPGQEAIQGNFGKPVITANTPIDLGQRIDLNSTEVGISKMSIILTWFISLTVIIMSSTAIAVKLDSYSWIVILIIVIFAIVYFVGLGYLSKAFFKLGDCGCTVTNILAPANAGASIVLNSPTQQSIQIAATHPAITSITQLSSYRINSFSTDQINLCRMAVVLTWILIFVFFGMPLIIR